MKPTTKNQLTPAEVRELAECEQIIERGLKNFVEVGNALLKVSDKRLYRQTHSTFKEYVEAKYEISVSRAYQLCEAAEVVKSLPPKMSNLLDTAAKATAVSRAPVENRPSVLKAAQAKAKAEKRDMTAKDIEAEIEPAPEPEPSPAPSVETEEDVAMHLSGFEVELKILVQSIPRDAVLKPYVTVLERQMSLLWNRAKVQVNRVQDSKNFSAYTS